MAQARELDGDLGPQDPGGDLGDLGLGVLLLLAGAAALWAVMNVIWLGATGAELQPGVLVTVSRDLTESWGAVRTTVTGAPHIFVPPLLLIFAVLGSIFFGIATPTEAGAVGSVGALILAALIAAAFLIPRRRRAQADQQGS